MLFFDFILERLNSDVLDSFNEVFSKFRSAIETFITKPEIFSESNITFITEKTTRDKISESYKLISKKSHSLFKGKLPQKYSYAQKKFIIENISIINNIYTIFNEERILADNVAFLKKRYPHAFKNYCKDSRIDSSKLSKVDKKEVLSNESVLAQEESKIIAQMRHEKLVSDFRNNILDRYPRKYYYKNYYSDFSSDKGMEYFLNHLIELDAFCKYEMEIAPYKALAHYVKDFLLSKNKETDDYVYLTSSDTMVAFHRFARTQIEEEYKLIESTYPIGTKYYTESINSRCLWPYPKPHFAIYMPAIFGNEPRKSRWEIEQEQKKQDDILRQASIKLTTKYLCICNIKEIKKLQNLYSKVDEIKKLYPRGSKLLIDNNPIKEDTKIVSSVRPIQVVDILNIGEPASIKGKSFVKYYSDFILARNLIHRLQSLSEWQQKQLDFCKFVRNLRDELNPSWGCYTYEFPFRGEVCDEASNFKTPDVNFKIWQFFIESFCSANLDYTLCPKYSLDNVNNKSLESGRITFKTWVYDKIKNFIASLKFEDYSPVVVFADTDERWEIYYKSSHFLYLRSILRDDAIPEFERFGYILNQNKSKKIIVVVDLITTNNQLKSFASDIIGNINDANLIVYISLRKEYSKEEMQSIIDSEQKKIDDKKALEEAERERRHREEERRRREEADIRETTQYLKNCVSEWPVLYGGLHYNYLINYYPTTCDFEATQSEWNDRWLVWNFKNTPGKTTEYHHQEALNNVVPRLTSFLKDTFGLYLNKLTLVCIPASSEENTYARFYEFSKLICNNTGMENSYDKISVLKSKVERRNGGTSIDTNNLQFDNAFFKGRYIILFDDVITRGDSMNSFKDKMQQLGSIVIAGISIGKTKHLRDF